MGYVDELNKRSSQGAQLFDSLVDTYGVTSGKGKRKAPVKGSSTNHQGTDLGMPEGTPVPALFPGTVVFTGDMGDGYGNHVEVLDERGNVHVYGHMGRIEVQEGDRVKVGDQLGLSGNTGNTSGPHLHYEVRKGTEYGQSYDPFKYLGR